MIQPQFHSPPSLRVRRIGDDAVGWSIDILDIPGELAHHLLPDPAPIDGGAADGTVSSPADTNVWHRVTIVGRPGPDVPSSGDRSAREEGREGGGQQDKGAGGDGEAGTETWSLSASVFVVKFESGRTATLDLSQLAIKWKHFCGVDGVDGGCGGGGDGGTEEVRGAQEQQPTRTPPGFGGHDGDGAGGGGGGGSGGLAYDDTDIGTRVDVWWPRYNSYFRATVRGVSEWYTAAGKVQGLVLCGETGLYLSFFFEVICPVHLGFYRQHPSSHVSLGQTGRAFFSVVAVLQPFTRMRPVTAAKLTVDQIDEWTMLFVAGVSRPFPEGK